MRMSSLVKAGPREVSVKNRWLLGWTLVRALFKLSRTSWSDSHPKWPSHAPHVRFQSKWKSLNETIATTGWQPQRRRTSFAKDQTLALDTTLKFPSCRPKIRRLMIWMRAWISHKSSIMRLHSVQPILTILLRLELLKDFLLSVFQRSWTAVWSLKNEIHLLETHMSHSLLRPCQFSFLKFQNWAARWKEHSLKRKFGNVIKRHIAPSITGKTHSISRSKEILMLKKWSRLIRRWGKRMLRKWWKWSQNTLLTRPSSRYRPPSLKV